MGPTGYQVASRLKYKRLFPLAIAKATQAVLNNYFNLFIYKIMHS